MIFSYKYVPHTMEKMQQFLDYIFYKVWCRASVSTPYSFELFNKKYQLKNIIVSFHYDDTKGGDLFNKTIEEVYKIFQTYTKKQKEEVKKWYKSNNNIEQLCINNPNMTAITYNQLALIDLGLSEKFKNFFPKLYGKDIIGLKVIKDVIGNIDSHYEKFIEKNGEGMQHIAFAVDNIEEAIADVKAKGARMIDETPRYGAGGAKIAFVHPKSSNRVLVELTQRDK